MPLINGKLNKSVNGTKLADEIHLNGRADAKGGAGNDTIFGSNYANKLYGQDGDDTIYTLNGKDSAWGGNGNDSLHAGDSGVKLYGEAGHDHLSGGMGTDFLDGGIGDDTIYGRGSDTLRGGNGNDWLWYSSHAGETGGVTQASKGVVSGGAGHDTLSFKVSSEAPTTPIEVFMTGESAGHVTIQGQQKLTFTGVNGIIDESWPWETNGSLTYHGENADTDMTVIGGAYDDTFYGGQGNEVFGGAGGDDTFVFLFKEGGMGHDRIGGFSQYTGPADPYENGFDTISFQGAEGKLTTIQTEFPVDPPPEFPDMYQGFTRYESYYQNGTLAHVLDVDAIGLPPISYDAIIG